MSAKTRHPLPLWRFNPLVERPARSQAELEASFNALWEIAVDEEED